MHPIPEYRDTLSGLSVNHAQFGGFDTPSARDARSNPVGPWAI